MSAVAAWLRELFVVPAPSAGATRRAAPARVAERAVPAALGVVGAGAEAGIAGGALALAAARAAGAPCAVVCLWGGAERRGAGGPAGPPARRLAGRLTARGLEASARGRLVRVALPADEPGARAAAERAAAAAGAVPVVVVLARPRGAVLDALLAAQDRVVVVPPPGVAPGLEELAVVGVARVARATSVLRVPPSPAGRALAAGGWAVTGALAASARDALEGHGG